MPTRPFELCGSSETYINSAVIHGASKRPHPSDIWQKFTKTVCLQHFSCQIYLAAKMVIQLPTDCAWKILYGW